MMIRREQMMNMTVRELYNKVANRGVVGSFNDFMCRIFNCAACPFDNQEYCTNKLSDWLDEEVNKDAELKPPAELPETYDKNNPRDVLHFESMRSYNKGYNDGYGNGYYNGFREGVGDMKDRFLRMFRGEENEAD